MNSLRLQSTWSRDDAHACDEVDVHPDIVSPQPTRHAPGIAPAGFVGTLRAIRHPPLVGTSTMPTNGVQERFLSWNFGL